MGCLGNSDLVPSDLEKDDLAKAMSQEDHGNHSYEQYVGGFELIALVVESADVI